jgi:hypothetical protein
MPELNKPSMEEKEDSVPTDDADIVLPITPSCDVTFEELT